MSRRKYRPFSCNISSWEKKRQRCKQPELGQSLICLLNNFREWSNWCSGHLEKVVSFLFYISFTMETALEKVNGLILRRIIQVSWKSCSQYLVTARGEALKRPLEEASENTHYVRRRLGNQLGSATRHLQSCPFGLSFVFWDLAWPECINSPRATEIHQSLWQHPCPSVCPKGWNQEGRGVKRIPLFYKLGIWGGGLIVIVINNNSEMWSHDELLTFYISSDHGTCDRKCCSL